MKKKILGLATTLTVLALLVVAVPAAPAGADTNPVYRALTGAAPTSAAQLETLAYWLGPNYNDVSKLISPFGAAAYTGNMNGANNDPDYTQLVPNRRENVPDQGDTGRIYSGTGAVTKTVGKLFYVESGTKPTISGQNDVAGDYNYLAKPLFGAGPGASADVQDIWWNKVGFTRVVNGDGTTTDSWTGVCSADAVVGANQSTILSAGHCVEAPGILALRGNPWYTSVTMSKWIFVPGFQGLTSHAVNPANPQTLDPTAVAQAAPYGVWVASNVYTTPYWDDWTHGQNGRHQYVMDFNALGYDFSAMTVVNPLSPGTTLSSVVGGQNVAFNNAMNQTITAFGYSQAPNTDYAQYWSGRSLATCAGSSFGDIVGTGNSGPNNEPGRQDHGLWCSLKEGSSGGPLFYNYDAATGTGTQISVVSFPEPPDYLMGPQFGPEIQAVYNAIQALTP